MLGMNPPDNDSWTTALLTNPEVLAVDQDTRSSPACRLANSPEGTEISKKELADGTFAIGFFNRTAAPIKLDLAWKGLGFAARAEVRDLWLRSNLEQQTNFVAELSPHACVLLQAGRNKK